MTKQYFINLAKYNNWANEITCQWLSQISDIQWNTNLVGSMESIAATVLHIASAEKIWFERLNNIQNPFFATAFNGSKSELITIWQATSNNLNNYILGISENELEESFNYQNLKGEKFTSKKMEAIAHVFNHSTYHRGQIVNYLRQVGFTDVSSTDLIQFYRNQDQ